MNSIIYIIKCIYFNITHILLVFITKLNMIDGSREKIVIEYMYLVNFMLAVHHFKVTGIGWMLLTCQINFACSENNQILVSFCILE